MSIKLYVIAAACENMGIGYKNDLPWRLRNEMAYFNRMTRTTVDPGSGKINAVLMGRRTWESVPTKFRPLPGRLNVVLSTNADAESLGIGENVLLCSKWNEVVEKLGELKESKEVDKVWVVGGSGIYKMAIESPLCYRIYLTRVLKSFDCDTFFPEFDKSQFKMIVDPDVPVDEQEENGIRYKFEVYEKVDTAEG